MLLNMNMIFFRSIMDGINKMKHSIILTIPFSFKGEIFRPSSIINLEVFCQKEFERNHLCYRVATENNIDRYSYEYEVLEASEFYFSEATGLAKHHLSESCFDLEGFKQSLKELKVLKILQIIAKQTLDVSNLEEHKKLKEALLQAYDAKC